MATRASQPLRRKSLYDMYEKAKVRRVELKRSRAWFSYSSRRSTFSLWSPSSTRPDWPALMERRGLLAVLCRQVQVRRRRDVGHHHRYRVPLRLSTTLHRLRAGPRSAAQDPESSTNHNTALLIPCYKSARIVGPTLEAALKVFPASSIFVIANGNSSTPLDDTESVCESYGCQSYMVARGIQDCRPSLSVATPPEILRTCFSLTTTALFQPTSQS